MAQVSRQRAQDSGQRPGASESMPQASGQRPPAGFGMVSRAHYEVLWVECDYYVDMITHGYVDATLYVDHLATKVVGSSTSVASVGHPPWRL
ncbi:hypothetical protein KI387_022339, partial [Taxus chinensis]